MTIQMKAIEQYFQVVLFIILYTMVLTFKSVDETLVCDHVTKWKLLSSTCKWCSLQVQPAELRHSRDVQVLQNILIKNALCDQRLSDQEKNNSYANNNLR